MNILALLPTVGKILDKVIPDKNAAAAAKLRLIELQNSKELAELDADIRLAEGQMETNKAEASSDDKFARRWRPAVGWVCVFGVGYTFLGFPILSWCSGIFEFPAPPPLDSGPLFTLLMGMLGFGGLRTYEKLNGIARGK